MRVVALGVDSFPVPGNAEARLRGRASLATPDGNPLGGHRVQLMIQQQAHDRTAALADGVGVAPALGAIGVGEGQDRGFF